MSVKKSPHSLKTDELLDLLDGKEVIEDVKVEYKNDILGFISTFGIEPGEEKIKQHTLFTIYKAWSQDPLKKTEFLAQMRDFLPTSRISNSYGFAINQSAIKLTHAAYKHFTNENHQLSGRRRTKHFENFLKFHSLTPGERWIHFEILYFIYDKYCHATGLDEHHTMYLTKEAFPAYCKLFLRHKNTKHGTLYGLSNNIESFFQIGQLQRMEIEYSKDVKKEKPKKRRKTP